MLSMHKLTVVGSYAYLTRQVAAGDAPLWARDSLSSYYQPTGNPAGRWAGEWIADLDRTESLAGGVVSELAMTRLFRCSHPSLTGPPRPVLLGDPPTTLSMDVWQGSRAPFVREFRPVGLIGRSHRRAAGDRSSERGHPRVVERDVLEVAGELKGLVQRRRAKQLERAALVVGPVELRATLVA